MKIKFGFIVAFLALFSPLHHALAKKSVSPTIEQCFGELQKTIPFKWEKPCAKLAEHKKTSKRDRARILFQLGHAMQEHTVEHQLSFHEAGQKAFAIWDDAIAVDPSFIEPYITIAYRSKLAAPADAMSYLDRALAQAPDEPLLLALKAATQVVIASSETPTEKSGQLCDKAITLAPSDQRVAEQCSIVFGRLKRDDDVLKLLNVAAKDYKFGTRRYWGMFQDSNPWMLIAKFHANHGNHAKAAETVTEYLMQNGVVALPEDVEARAGYHELAGNYAEAAADYARMTTSAGYPRIQAARVKQILNLIKAGEGEEAKRVADVAFSSKNLRGVLQLQVRLKNTDFPDLVINGQYDQETKDALNQCLTTDKCANGIAGQRT